MAGLIDVVRKAMGLDPLIQQSDLDRRLAGLQTLLAAYRRDNLDQVSGFLNAQDKGLLGPNAEQGYQEASKLIQPLDTVDAGTAAALGQQFAPPGTRTYENFANELGTLRASKVLSQDPRLAAALGLSGVTSPDELATRLQLITQAGQGREIRDVTHAGGRTTSLVNKATAEVIPVGEEQPSDQSLLNTIFEHGITGEVGGLPVSLGSTMSEAGRQLAKDQGTIRRQRDATIQLGAIANTLADSLKDVEGGKVIGGRTASLAGSLKSALTQIGGIARVTGIPGIQNVSELLNQGTSGAFDTTAIYGAKVDPLHLALAVAYAQGLSEDENVSREELRNALQATESISSGDPAQIRASMESLLKLQVDKVNRQGARFKFDPIDLKTLAPSLYTEPAAPGPGPQPTPAPGAATAPVRKAYTWGELKKMQQGGQ